jgi:hypothetical protein
MTSSDSPKDRSETSAAGATAYFRKPLDLDAFLSIGGLVRQILSGAGAPGR